MTANRRTHAGLRRPAWIVSKTYGRTGPKLMLAFAAIEVAAWFREPIPVLKLADWMPAKFANDPPATEMSPVRKVPWLAVAEPPAPPLPAAPPAPPDVPAAPAVPVPVPGVPEPAVPPWPPPPPLAPLALAAA